VFQIPTPTRPQGNHITRRDGGVWYYNRILPEHQAGAIGKRQIRFSLKTHDKALAQRLARQYDVALEARLSSGSGSSPDARLRGDLMQAAEVFARSLGEYGDDPTALSVEHWLDILREKTKQHGVRREAVAWMEPRHPEPDREEGGPSPIVEALEDATQRALNLPAAWTVKRAIEEFLDAKARTLRATTLADYRFPLNMLMERHGRQPMAQFAKSDALKFIETTILPRDGSKTTKDKWVTTIGAVWRWHKARDRVTIDPWEDLKGLIERGTYVAREDAAAREAYHRR